MLVESPLHRQTALARAASLRSAAKRGLLKAAKLQELSIFAKQTPHGTNSV